MTDPTNNPDHDQIVNGRSPHDPPRSGRRNAAIGLIAVAGMAAGAAVLYVASTAGAAPSSSTNSTNSTTSSAGTTSTSSSKSCPVPAAGRPGGPGGPRGALGGPGGAGADGRITAVSSSSVTVRDLFGKAHTYKITSATTIHDGPARSVKAGSLSIGEHVRVRSSTSASTAADIDVVPASIDGAVASVASGSITVTDPSGFTRVIDTGSQTKYTLNASSSTRSKVITGSVVHAEGTVDANGTALDASSVDLRTSATTKPVPPAGASTCTRMNGPGGQHGPGRPGRLGGQPSGSVPSSGSTTRSSAAPTPTASH